MLNNVKQITGSTPLSGSAPKVNVFFPDPFHILLPTFLVICQLVKPCWQINQQTKYSGENTTSLAEV